MERLCCGPSNSAEARASRSWIACSSRGTASGGAASWAHGTPEPTSIATSTTTGATRVFAPAARMFLGIPSALCAI